MADGTLDPSQSTLSPNFAPYIYDMLSMGQGLANLPYQPYTGQRYAGPSQLQRQAFSGLAGLETPAAFRQSTNLLRQAGQAAQGFQYAPGQFGVQVGDTGLGSLGFTAGQFGADMGQANFGGLGYTPGQISTGLGPVGSVTDYMNPYTQNVTNVLAREATRQSEIQRQADQARLAQAGAYGGSRQAILDAERARNLSTQIGDITEKGLSSAFEQAQRQRLAEAQLGTEAQRLTEAGRQFGAGFGLDVEKAAEAARQFRGQQGLEAQRLGEQSRQFGATYGLDTEKAAEAARQFRAQQGLEAQRLGEQSRQFGATSGLDALSRQIAAGQGLAQTGVQQSAADRALEELRLSAGATQRGLRQDDLDFAYQQWQESMKWPYQQATFMQSLLQGLPMEANQYQSGQSAMNALLGGILSALGLEKYLKQP